MKWRGRRTSSNVEDRRGAGGGFGDMGGPRIGMGGGPRMGRGGARLGGVGLLIVVLVGAFLGIDTSFLLGGGGAGLAPPVERTAAGPNRIDDEAEEFVAVVLADTEEVWGELFAASGAHYSPPVLVLFDGQVRSACGIAGAASGPFYCPADRKAYLDTSFFRTLAGQLGAAGDFAAAYVIAHEVAHHVQNELGLMREVNAVRARASERQANALSVRVELQADCLSGVWAHHADRRFGILEAGDIEEALNAASRIGDDTLQRSAGRAVVPDSFTHGTSDQRVRWFRRGFETGDPGACDTFAADRL